MKAILFAILTVAGSASALAADQPTNIDAPERVVCRREVPLGTIMPRRVCRSERDRERQARDSVATRERIGQSGNGRALDEDVR